jgi:hypothetical protein
LCSRNHEGKERGSKKKTGYYNRLQKEGPTNDELKSGKPAPSMVVERKKGKRRKR